jgi:tetratricopeptide (TPR) repeat protein
LRPRPRTRAATLLTVTRATLLGCFACAFCAAATPARVSALGAQQPAATPRPAPSRPAASPSATPASQPAAQQQPAALVSPVPRETRAKAYAKLLEGQRYVSRARTAGGITREALAAAQSAFRQAAELDPTLSEAHTALAELAFFFLDDQAAAERHARNALAINPDNFGAHRLLSRLYALRAGTDPVNFKREDADRAVAELREVLRLDSNDAEALALLGEFYSLTGKEAEAVEMFRRWVGAPSTLDTQFYRAATRGGELTPDAAWGRLAQSLLKLGRTGEAIDALRQALSADPENQNLLRLIARAVEQGGDAGAALAELKRLADTYPDSAALASLYARTLARANRVDEAAAALRAAAARADADRRAQLTDELAQMLTEAMRYDEALAALEELLRSRGVSDAPLVADSDKQFAGEYLQRIVNVQRQAGREPDALKTVERMRRLLGPSSVMADFYQVTVLRDQGKRKEALEAVRAARLRQPDHPALLRLEATTLAELGQVEEAAQLLRARLSGDPAEDFDTQLTIASVYLEVGRAREAVAAATKLVEMAPPGQPARMKQALVMLSSAQERAGDFKAAEESLRRILARDPDDATALNNLGYFLTERGERLQEALEMIKRAVRAEPANPSYLDSLGWVYFKLGQLEEAERHLSDAARRNPRSAAIYEHLGDLHQRRGRTEDARAAWRKALSLSVEAAETARLKAKIGGTTAK